MTILSVCQNVSLVIGIDKPDGVFASTDREHMELARLANVCAEAIRDAHDWQKLQTEATFTGDGSAEAFALPADFDRMKADASVWSSRWTWAFDHITSTDTWLEYQEVPYSFVNGTWIIYGGEFHVLPVMALAETAKFFYISKYAVNAGTQETFIDDGDTFDLSERLLELAMIWQWRQNKGLPYAEDMATFSGKLGKEIAKDGGSKPIVGGNPSTVVRKGIWAFPQTVGA